MKKISFFLAAICTLSAFTMTVFAAASQKESFDIPYAVTAPTIDGKKGSGEWDNALVRTLTASNVDEPTKTGAKTEGATFSWMWDDKGVYFLAEVNDTTPMSGAHKTGNGSYNAKDGIQFCIYGNNTVSGNANGTLLFYSVVPKTSDGTPAIGEHFCYGNGSAGKDVPASDAQIAAEYTDGGYVLEGFIAKESLTKPNPAVDFKAGGSFALGNIIMDEFDGKTTALFTDTAWFSGKNSNMYTLSADKKAGYVEPEAAPSTADPAILAALAALAAGAAAIVSKKRR